jgi:hypothetical protein
LGIFTAAGVVVVAACGVVVAACGCGTAEETTFDGMRSAAQAAAVTRVLRLARFEFIDRPSRGFGL